jgi:phage repressor protein C with HTH and peptisase S24 domain
MDIAKLLRAKFKAPEIERQVADGELESIRHAMKEKSQGDMPSKTNRPHAFMRSKPLHVGWEQLSVVLTAAQVPAQYMAGEPFASKRALLEQAYKQHLGERLVEARGQVSLASLADHLGRHLNAVSKWNAGKTMPDAFDLLCYAAFTGTNPYWVLTGQGRKEDLRNQQALAANDDEFVLVPRYSVSASAGDGREVVDEDVVAQFAFRKSWIQQRGLRPEALKVVRADGDSMQNTIYDGDMLLIDTSISHVVTDGIYVIGRNGDLFCKRLQIMFNGGVTIKSDNPAYADQTLDGEAASELKVVGRVVWAGGER